MKNIKALLIVASLTPGLVAAQFVKHTFEDGRVNLPSNPANWQVRTNGAWYEIGTETWRGWNEQQQGLLRPYISNGRRITPKSLWLGVDRRNPSSVFSQRNEPVLIGEQGANSMPSGYRRYIGFSFNLTSDFQSPGGWFHLHQTKQGRRIGKNNIPFIQFGFHNGDERLQLWINPIIRNRFTLFKPKRNIWYDVVIGYQTAPNDESGFAFVWIKEKNQNKYVRYGSGAIKVGYADQPKTHDRTNYGIYKQTDNRMQTLRFDEVATDRWFGSVQIPGATK